MNIGIIDIDSKIPNLALMKISTFHKQKGDQIFLGKAKGMDIVYISVLFTKNRGKVLNLINAYPDTHFEIGGTGWDLKTSLPIEIECQVPDYSLYSIQDLYPRIKGINKRSKREKKAEQLLTAGIGFLNRGCIRKCPFCCVPKKEGRLQHVNSLSEIINPQSRTVILMDNNITAAPDFFDILSEISERKLTVDITQGIDIRLIDDHKALALSQVKHLRSIHYSWDLMESEARVLEGISILSKYIRPYRHLCFILVGYNTTLEEDEYRFRKLTELNVDPFVMKFQPPEYPASQSDKSKDVQLSHFARWVNSRIYKVCDFSEYTPFKKYLSQSSFSYS